MPEPAAPKRLIERVELLEGPRGSEGVAHLQMDVVEPLLEKLQHPGPFREGIREFQAPGPGLARRGLPGLDDPASGAIHGEPVSHEPAPAVLAGAGPR